MLPVSTEYKRQLIAGNRRWLIKVDMTLADTTPLELKNEDIWDNGIVIDEGISSDSTFDLGGTIIGGLKVVIDNIHGNYSQYDFFDARLVLYLGVEGDIDEYDVQRYYRIGNYVVDKPNYNGSLITLECLNNMTWFDTPFTGISTVKTTAGQIVADICTLVGVTLATPQFPNYTTAISVELSQNMNCREALHYIAEMCCCYCKMNTAGQLVLAWYNKQEIIGITGFDGGTFNTTTTPYSDGDAVDGGTFNPWNAGDSADGGTFADLRDAVYISQNFEMNVSTDDVVVTGCRVRNTTSNDDGAFDELWVDANVELTHDRYVLVIENNPFIVTQVQAAAIANTVGSILAGLPIRRFTATSLADFSYETGDMATIVDFRGHVYHTWLTSFTFTTNNSERFACGVQSLREKSEERFSTAAEIIEKSKTVLTAYDKAVKAMDELAQEAIGYNEYIYHSGTGDVMYRFDNIADMPSAQVADPKFLYSDIIFKISGDGVFVARRNHGDIDPDGTCHYSNGYDANSGTAILSLIYVNGLVADWIKSGTLTLGGVNNKDGVLEIYANDGTTLIGKWDKDGINATKGTFSGTLNAASGTLSDGVGTLSLSSGDLNMTNAGSGGAGIFARRSDGAYYSCWGARNIAAEANGHYLEYPTYMLLEIMQYWDEHGHW